MSEYFNSASKDWRISQCCQFFDPKLVKLYNPGTVTKTTALTASGKQKVQEKALSNLDKLLLTLDNYFSKQPMNLRSFRISSYLLPCYTLPETKDWYNEIEHIIQAKFKKIGDSARQHNIRLSTHPGQYTVLGSNNLDVVKNSIVDLEYHALFGKLAEIPANQFTINIHLSGVYGGSREAGIKRFADNFSYLSDYAQSCLAVENEDKPNGYDIEHVIALCTKIPTRATLDIHHYDCWGKRSRPYITHNMDAFKESVKTWRGIRPLFHVSHTRQENGIDVARINEHSEFLYDREKLETMIPMLQYADFDIEAKNKEAAVLDAYKYILEEENYAGEKLVVK
jgi:UV damage endonuclease UvdE